MKHIFISAILLLLSASMFAESTENRQKNRHEISMGYGDAYSLMSMPNYFFNWYYYGESGESPMGNNKCTGYISFNYQYRINKWLDIGMEYNYINLVNETNYDLTNDNTNSPMFGLKDSWITKEDGYLYYTRDYTSHIIMLTTQFTYFHHKWVSLYSGVSLGLNIEGIKRHDYFNTVTCKIPPSFALDIKAIGVSIGKENIFASVELGGLFLIPRYYPNRIINISVGYRF